MKKNLKRFLKLNFVAIMMIQLLYLPNAFAAQNITINSLEQSKKEIVLNQNGKLMLKQDWYGMRFEINPSKVIGSRQIKAVNSKYYDEALEKVNFDLESVGEYKVYFLDYRLKNYSTALALSFKDDSVVVFGTKTTQRESDVHRLAVHELGHQVDFKLMNDKKWEEYKSIRGLKNELVYNNYTSEYKNRLQEIFAEDFRLVCGGTLAQKTAHINTSIGDPRSNKQVVAFFENL